MEKNRRSYGKRKQQILKKNEKERRRRKSIKENKNYLNFFYIFSPVICVIYLKVSFSFHQTMDLFALERSIKELEEKKSRVEYRPFLGVANFNTGKELIEKKS